MVKKIAITGGIGSGKSTVSRRIKGAGYPVFSCDELYKNILRNPTYVQRVAARFPACVTNGEIDKAKLASVVFKNKKERAALNAIAHPLVMQALFSRMEECDSRLVFAEVPLLFEGDFQTQFDEVIVVLREKEQRIDSVVHRDGLLPTEVEDRILAQFDYQSKEAEKIFKEDKVILIENNQTEEELNKRIDEILSRL